MYKKNIFITNFIRWSIICTISAAPSFVLAINDKNSGFNPLAMILGVVIFIFIYSFITSSDFYAYLRKFNNIYKALKFSYLLKIIMAIIAFPFSFFAFHGKDSIAMFFILPDFYAGILSYIAYSWIINTNMHTVNESRTGGYEITFVDTLMITLIEGIILSLMILLFSLIMLLIFKIYEKCKLALKRKKA